MIKRFSVSSYISVAGWFINAMHIVMYGMLSWHNPRHSAENLLSQLQVILSIIVVVVL